MKISKDFIQHVRDHLKEYDFRLVLAKSKQVNTGTGFRCSGFFDEYTRQIRVAMYSSQWLEVLVHEYCHFLDYLDSPRKELDKENSAVHICKRHMSGDICHPISVKSAFYRIRLAEWKAEKRVPSIIRQWNLPINIQRYIREANLNICLYHMYMKYGRYNTKGNPVNSKVLAKMPKRISRRMVSEISDDIEKALIEYFQ